ncbi:MAG: DUF3502 domain-containing protein, partial [Spirochaetales bacterium]
DFAFDPTPVATELAALSNVQSTYMPILRWGVADTEETVADYVADLEKAGLRVLEAELNAQWQEYKQNK